MTVSSIHRHVLSLALGRVPGALRGERKCQQPIWKITCPQHEGVVDSQLLGVGVNLDLLTLLSCKKSSYPNLV